MPVPSIISRLHIENIAQCSPNKDLFYVYTFTYHVQYSHINIYCAGHLKIYITNLNNMKNSRHSLMDLISVLRF